MSERTCEIKIRSGIVALGPKCVRVVAIDDAGDLRAVNLPRSHVTEVDAVTIEIPEWLAVDRELRGTA